MAKALFGHVGHDLDLRMASELRRMRDRVRDLENQVARLEAANLELASQKVLNDDMLTLAATERFGVVPDHVDEREPALT